MLRAGVLCFVVALCAVCSAQSSPPSSVPSEPLMAKVRRSVTFITLGCREGAQEYTARGTGFFVGYPLPKLTDRMFAYLVTNKHVALCLDDTGHAMEVTRISIRLNRRIAQDGSFSQDLFLNEHGNVGWIIPSDDSVDLAVLPLSAIPSQSAFDYTVVPTELFATSDFVSKQSVTEGDSVFFAGFFQQFPGTIKMEPIVRQGIIAMMPGEKLPFVGAQERVYLADVHVFHGNSGSPAFISMGGFHHGGFWAGEDYRLLGVVNAYLVEDQQLNLRLENDVVMALGTSGSSVRAVRGVGEANSGISTIVPADEIRALLEDPRLKRDREERARTISGENPRSE